MSNLDSTPDDLAALASALKGLRPAAASIDRDRLLYEAGRRSARRSGLWPASTFLACLTAGATALAWLWSSPDVTERIVYLPSAPAVQPPLVTHDEPPPPLDYRDLRDTVLRLGVQTVPITIDLPPRPVPTAGGYARTTFEILSEGGHE